MKKRNGIVVPARSERSFFGHGIPGVNLEELAGKLIAVETGKWGKVITMANIKVG